VPESIAALPAAGNRQIIEGDVEFQFRGTNDTADLEDTSTGPGSPVSYNLQDHTRKAPSDLTNSLASA